jgi:hypothetical protein
MTSQEQQMTEIEQAADRARESKAAFDREAAEYAFMDDTAEVMAGPAPVVTTTYVATDPAGKFDADLIADARALAELYNHETRAAYLTATGSTQAGDDYDIVRAMVTGRMQHDLSSLASGYERELASVAKLRAENAKLRAQVDNMGQRLAEAVGR